MQSKWRFWLELGLKVEPLLYNKALVSWTLPFIDCMVDIMSYLSVEKLTKTIHNPARNVQIEDNKKHQYFRVSRQSGWIVASMRMSAATRVVLRAGEGGRAPPLASSVVIQSSGQASGVPASISTSNSCSSTWLTLAWTRLHKNARKYRKVLINCSLFWFK